MGTVLRVRRSHRTDAALLGGVGNLAVRTAR